MFCSIIIPVYNPNIQRFSYLLECLNRQTCKDFKVYFVNDCSSESGFREEILNTLKDDVVYEILDLEENIGQGLARQKAIDLSDDDWVTFVDQDDGFVDEAIERAKRIIEESGCEFLLSTQSIVANDRNWTSTNEYVIENCVSVLHGKFYKREQLLKYNIHFTDKVRAHEDTFFQNLMYSYFMLAPELNSEKVNVLCDDITYIWYLWSDSTSHSRVFDNVHLGNISYLESSMREYVIATLESYKEVKNKYPVNDDYLYSKFSSFLYFTYWFEQSFEYFNPLLWKKDNLVYIREAVRFIMNEFGLSSYRELTDILIDIPGVYYFTFNEVFTNVDGYFVPRLTVEQYYQTLDDRIKEFKLSDVQFKL